MNEQNNNVQNTNQTVNNSVQVVKTTNGFAVAGFVISLVSLLCCGGFSWLGLIFSIVGLVNSKNMNNEGKGLAIAGIVISSIFLILAIVLYAFGITASVLESIQS